MSILCVSIRITWSGLYSSNPAPRDRKTLMTTTRDLGYVPPSPPHPAKQRPDCSSNPAKRNRHYHLRETCILPNTACRRVCTPTKSTSAAMFTITTTN
ncbi:hypothetical protein T484DRAFT_1969141 [Baffinella frigidus]|nr:hypothetical protein T484DRAFT_1969141 [Cryptophyta sp. CCMP2293]